MSEYTPKPRNTKRAKVFLLVEVDIEHDQLSGEAPSQATFEYSAKNLLDDLIENNRLDLKRGLRNCETRFFGPMILPSDFDRDFAQVSFSRLMRKASLAVKE